MNKNKMFLKDDKSFIDNKNRIVFLDIDGVIAQGSKNDWYIHDINKTIDYLVNKYKDDIYKRMKQYDVLAAYYDWDPLSIGKLKKLLDITYSEIVILSNFRFGNTMESLKALFKLHAMDEYILDRCPAFDDKIDAINEYLNGNIVDNYVIFDDNEKLKIFDGNFIQTYGYLSDENIDAAYRVLTK